jgi:hypothetical protein
VSAQLKPVPHFARETCDQVHAEIQALTEAHYAEVAHHPEIPPGMDEAKYRQAEKLGILRIYTVRVLGKLVGYEVFTVGHSWHYKTSFQARMDTVFIHPDYRLGATGYRFLKWCMSQLELEGVEISYQHDKILPGGRLDLGPLFRRMGYEEIYRVYWRRHGNR